MITRVRRLVQAELIKLSSHPFFLVSSAIVILGTVVGALVLRDGRETVWRSFNAIGVFAGGAKVGFKLSTFVVLIFGSMLFSGEFDRGTIKILLTRPITRTDLFAAKALTALLLSLFFILLVIYVAAVTGCATGELGPVWDTETYNSNTTYERLLGHAAKAVGMSAAGLVAAACVGLFISSLTESSGFSVALALIAFVLADEIMLRAFRDDGVRRWFFNHYPDYALNVLRDFSTGSSPMWKGIFVEGAGILRWPFLTVPLATIAAAVSGAYAVFRTRDVTA